jgi:hypothetical protein
LEHIIGVHSKEQTSTITVSHADAKTAEDGKQQLLESRAGNLSADLTRRGKLLKKKRLKAAFWINVHNGQKMNDGNSQVLTHANFLQALSWPLFHMRSTSVPSQAV